MRHLRWLFLILLLAACGPRPTPAASPTAAATAAPPSGTPTPTLQPSQAQPAITPLSPNPQQPQQITNWQICRGCLTSSSGEYTYELLYPATWMMDEDPFMMGCALLISALDSEGRLPPGEAKIELSVVPYQEALAAIPSSYSVVPFETPTLKGVTYAYYDSLFGLSFYEVLIPQDEQALRLTFMAFARPEKAEALRDLFGFMLYTLTLNSE